ncbi:hypothetical protein [uncultured Chryseobacterium sp.]|uniref:hypothetical protein n=1 Tax=uncultured Chryseobacterium sp. TaxID=259322 RepID=UPI0027DCBB7D|nr:hypothetical protein [uncultured Chryseobacterium sp.]
MNNFKDKSIILAVPDHFGLPQVFKENLEFLGFIVYLVKHDNSKIKLKTKDSLIHLYKKTFSKNRTHKARITALEKESPQITFLNGIESADYALVIRPDLFSEKVLQKIKSKSKHTVGYQWDGMKRFPLAENMIPYFNRFFVFDSNDVKKYPHVQPINNFYFDYLHPKKEIKQDVFFVGTFMKDRINELLQLSLIFKKIGLKSSINIICSKSKYYKKYSDFPVHFTKSGMDFKDSILNTQQSNVILDFQNSMHNGVSFRVFGAVGYQKKLITNNPLVKNYDFYNPHNIFVFTNENIHEVEHFLKQDFVELPPEIREKYSFTHWIKQILNSN